MSVKAGKNSVKPYQDAKKEEEFLKQLEEAGLPKPRPLSWGEMGEIEDQGLDPFADEDSLGPIKIKKLLRWIADHVYEEEISKDHPGDLVMALCAETFRVTYGSILGRKN